MALVSAAMMSSALVAQAPASYVLTNDDGTDHSYVSFYAPSGTQSARASPFHST